MTILTIPPDRAEDIDRVKDFLFQTLGESAWSEEAYLAYADRFPRLVELSEGRLWVLEMPSPRHQRIVQAAYKIVDAWALAHDGEAFVAPMPIRLWPGKFREPDVMLYSAAARERIGEAYGGPPDLVVEVQSPGTARLDSTEKLGEYAQAGIPEYWRLDPERRQLEQNVLDGSSYVVHALLGVDERVRAATLPDLECAVAALFGLDRHRD